MSCKGIKLMGLDPKFIFAHDYNTTILTCSGLLPQPTYSSSFTHTGSFCNIYRCALLLNSLFLQTVQLKPPKTQIKTTTMHTANVLYQWPRMFHPFWMLITADIMKPFAFCYTALNTFFPTCQKQQLLSTSPVGSQLMYYTTNKPAEWEDFKVALLSLTQWFSSRVLHCGCSQVRLPWCTLLLLSDQPKVGRS